MKNHPPIQVTNTPSRLRAAWVFALLLGFTALLAPVPQAPAQAQDPDGSIRVSVNGIVCAFCVQGVQRHFTAREEVKRIFISLEHSVVLLELYPDKEFPDQAITDTTKRAGYEVVRIERLEDPFDKERKRLRERK